jgi:hypothetical protein
MLPTAMAARVGKVRRSVRVPEPTEVYQPQRLALRVREGVVVLTKVQNRWERDSGEKTTMTGGEEGRAPAEEDDAGAAGPSGWRELLRKVPATGIGGSARHEGYGDRQ